MCLNVQTIGLFLWQYFSWGKDLTILLAMQNLVHRFGFLSDHRRQPHLYAAKDCAAAGHIIEELSFPLFIFKLLSYISLDPNSLLSTLLWISLQFHLNSIVFLHTTLKLGRLQQLQRSCCGMFAAAQYHFANLNFESTRLVENLPTNGKLQEMGTNQ